MYKKTDEKYLDLANKVGDLTNNKLSAYGEFVREMRMSRGLYLKQMADFIGIGSAHMSGIEFGRHELTKEVLQKTFEFFTQSPAVEPAHDEVPMPQNADQAQLMALLAENWLKHNAPERLKEPAQAVPSDSDRVFDDGYLLGLKAGYSFGKSNSEAGEIAYTNAVRAREKLQKEYKLQAAPPAIDDETKRMVLELLRHVDRGYHTIGQQHEMATLMGQIRKKLEAGNGE